jgi:hypothetical protein
MGIYLNWGEDRESDTWTCADGISGDASGIHYREYTIDDI